jgi:uncharacterized membrane protein
MNEFALLRALHVLGVVLWIGGVAFVTTVLLPALQHDASAKDRLERFDRLERRFAWQARGTTLLVGVTGLWMTARYGLWPRFGMPAFWWMHAMVLVWALFSLMLFLLEPAFLHRWLRARNLRDPVATFALVARLHRLLLALSLIAVFGAVAGSHGG